MELFRHVIVTRFSFRFRETDPKLPLLSNQRLDERIRIFKNFCFSSMIGQKNPNFDWILIIDPELPEEYRIKLEEIFDEFKKSSAYPNRGPRNIWLHPWNWEKYNLQEIDWIIPYLCKQTTNRSHHDALYQTTNRSHHDALYQTTNTYSKILNATYLVTTRLDDDDCLSEDFINMVNSHLRKNHPIDGFCYLSFCNGYQYQVEPKILKRVRNPLIALGLTLIANIDKYPICVYLGSHTQIGNYLRNPKLHPRMLELYTKNKDLPVTHRQQTHRLNIIRSTKPAFVRNVHGFNLQKNIRRFQSQPPKYFELIQKTLKNDFHVTI